MNEKKMTDEELIKALECCKEGWCAACVRYFDESLPQEDGCRRDTISLSLDLINRQKAEIERLTERKERISWSKQEYLDWVHGFLTTNTEMKDRGKDYEMFDRDWMCEIFWAKIEGSIEYIIDLENQRTELQKQVDELKKSQVIECHGMLKGCDMVKQAVKDAVQKIIIELNRLKNIVRESYGISEQVGVDIAINRVENYLKEITENDNG